jgi:prophage regulatory protein
MSTNLKYELKFNRDSNIDSPRQLIRLPEVLRRTGFGRSYIYRECSAAPPRFPRPVKVGRASAWDAEAVDHWIMQKLNGASVSERKV